MSCFLFSFAWSYFYWNETFRQTQFSQYWWRVICPSPSPLTQTVFSQGCVLSTLLLLFSCDLVYIFIVMRLNGDIAWLLNSLRFSLILLPCLLLREQRKRDTGDVSSILWAEVTKVNRKLRGGQVPWVDEIRPEYLKSFNVQELSWRTRVFNIILTSAV